MQQTCHPGTQEHGQASTSVDTVHLTIGAYSWLLPLHVHSISFSVQLSLHGQNPSCRTLPGKEFGPGLQLSPNLRSGIQCEPINHSKAFSQDSSICWKFYELLVYNRWQVLHYVQSCIYGISVLSLSTACLFFREISDVLFSCFKFSQLSQLFSSWLLNFGLSYWAFYREGIVNWCFN